MGMYPSILRANAPPLTGGRIIAVQPCLRRAYCTERSTANLEVTDTSLIVIHLTVFDLACLSFLAQLAAF